MQLFGIGPLEFLLILVIAVIILGPKGMVTAAREAGKLIRKITRSPLWRERVDTSNGIRDLPRKIVRDAGIEQDRDELRKAAGTTFREIDAIQISKATPEISIDNNQLKTEESGTDEHQDAAQK